MKIILNLELSMNRKMTQVEDEAKEEEVSHHPVDQPERILRCPEVKLTKGQTIKYWSDEGGGISLEAKILGRAGKAAGKYNNWYKLEYLKSDKYAGKTSSADISQAKDFQAVFYLRFQQLKGWNNLLDHSVISKLLYRCIY